MLPGAEMLLCLQVAGADVTLLLALKKARESLPAGEAPCMAWNFQTILAKTLCSVFVFFSLLVQIFSKSDVFTNDKKNA